MTTLAQANPSADTTSVILWSMVLLAFLVMGFVLVMRLQRRMQRVDDEAPASPLGFTLSDLRQLHQSGQMTDEEFERARGKLLAVMQRQPEKAPSTRPPV